MTNRLIVNGTQNGNVYNKLYNIDYAQFGESILTLLP